MVLLGVKGELDARFGPFGDSANLDPFGDSVSVECKIGARFCVKRTIGLEIVLNAPYGIPR